MYTFFVKISYKVRLTSSFLRDHMRQSQRHKAWEFFNPTLLPRKIFFEQTAKNRGFSHSTAILHSETAVSWKKPPLTAVFPYRGMIETRFSYRKPRY